MCKNASFHRYYTISRNTLLSVFCIVWLLFTLRGPFERWTFAPFSMEVLYFAFVFVGYSEWPTGLTEKWMKQEKINSTVQWVWVLSFQILVLGKGMSVLFSVQRCIGKLIFNSFLHDVWCFNMWRWLQSYFYLNFFLEEHISCLMEPLSFGITA